MLIFLFSLTIERPLLGVVKVGLHLLLVQFGSVDVVDAVHCGVVQQQLLVQGGSAVAGGGCAVQQQGSAVQRLALGLGLHILLGVLQQKILTKDISMNNKFSMPILLDKFL